MKFIVGLGPGAAQDIAARMFGEQLSRRWDQPVVIENRPGGDGIVAINAFIGAHDTHTLLFAASGTFTAHPTQYAKMPYDPSEIVPLARVSSTIIGVVGADRAQRQYARRFGGAGAQRAGRVERGAGAGNDRDHV